MHLPNVLPLNDRITRYEHSTTMTSKEIKDTLPMQFSTAGWLKEVAFQLALLNEKPESAPAPAKQPFQQGRR